MVSRRTIQYDKLDIPAPAPPFLLVAVSKALSIRKISSFETRKETEKTTRRHKITNEISNTLSLVA